MSPDQLQMFPLWYVAFLLSLTCHEAAHALAAKWGGDLTAYYSGQVTLNPYPHIRREPFGTVVVPLLTYFMGGSMLGWGSAPYDPYWEQRHPKRAALMAAAGPAANFALVLAAAVIIHGGILGGAFQIPAHLSFIHIVDGTGTLSSGAADFVSIVFSLNLLLGVFNLFPTAPLDGHSVLGLVLPEGTFVRWLEFIRQPMTSMIGLLVAWRLFDQVFWPVFRTALSTLYWGESFR